MLSGELTLTTEPPTRIYLRDGVVYFAERSSDCTLPIRLMIEGVINRQQMLRGTVTVNGIEHIGRMFDADPTIDRTSVEVCTEKITDDLMVVVANETIDSYKLALYRRHPSGVDRWYHRAVRADLTDEPSNVFAAPVTQPVSVTPPHTASRGQETISALITAPVPVVPATAPMATPHSAAVNAGSDIDVSAIADEVAAAIERVLASTASAV